MNKNRIRRILFRVHRRSPSDVVFFCSHKHVARINKYCYLSCNKRSIIQIKEWQIKQSGILYNSLYPCPLWANRKVTSWRCLQIRLRSLEWRIVGTISIVLKLKSSVYAFFKNCRIKTIYVHYRKISNSFVLAAKKVQKRSARPRGITRF